MLVFKPPFSSYIVKLFNFPDFSVNIYGLPKFAKSKFWAQLVESFYWTQTNQTNKQTKEVR